MGSGFFLVYRKLFDHEIGQNPIIVALWVKLISMASYEDKEVFWDKSTIQIKRGEIITSIDKLSKWLRVTRSTTKRHLIALQTIRQIDIKTTNKYTVISIRNYDKYQAREQQIEQQTNIKLLNKSPQLNNINNIKKLTNIEREEKTPLSYLLDIPKTDLDEFVTKFKCSQGMVIEKAEALVDYVKSHNKKYVDYKSLLNNALRKDFGKRPIEVKFVAEESAPVLSKEDYDKAQNRLNEIRNKLKPKFNLERKMLTTEQEETRRAELLRQKDIAPF